MTASIPAAVSEEVARPRAKKLPEDSEIDHFEAAMTGWVVYYHQATINRVVGLPVMMWVLVSYSEKQPGRRGDEWTTKQEIRHFVVTDSGACVDYMDIAEGDFLCVIGPMIQDHAAVVRQHLAERGLDFTNMQTPSGN